MQRRIIEYKTPSMSRRWPGLGTAMQLCAILSGWLIAPLWVVMAIISFPWIVAADSDPKLATAHELASIAALGLAISTGVSLLLASGMFRNWKTRWLIAAILLAGHALAGCFLYDHILFSAGLVPFYLLGQGASIGIAVLGAKYGLAEPR